jgi:uncharacterized membrane protein YoaK (UPF0700 family)
MRLVKKLERWVWYGGATLAMIAGIVNVVGFLSFDHHAITHLTGTTSELGMAIVRGDMNGIVHLALVMLSFVFGCINYKALCILLDYIYIFYVGTRTIQHQVSVLHFRTIR